MKQSGGKCVGLLVILFILFAESSFADRIVFKDKLGSPHLDVLAYFDTEIGEWGHGVILFQAVPGGFYHHMKLTGYDYFDRDWTPINGGLERNPNLHICWIYTWDPFWGFLIFGCIVWHEKHQTAMMDIYSVDGRWYEVQLEFTILPKDLLVQEQ